MVVDAVGRLTDEHDDLPEGTHARAEAHLLDLAGEFDAAMLRRLGKRLFEVVCPEAADQAEGSVSRARRSSPGAGPTSRRTTTATAPSTAGSGCPRCMPRS